MDDSWLDETGRVLGPGFPLALDAPFTTAQALDSGVSRRSFGRLLRTGLIRCELRGVYAVAQAPNDPMMRAAAVGLVLPPEAVVVDRTAAWLHGVDALRRSAVQGPPPLDVVHMSDTRMNRPGVDGRRRGLLPTDVTLVQGIPVTTRLRTALDCGRLLWRFDALAVVDGVVRLGVPVDQMVGELARFRGFRGVIQLRYLVSIADGRAESGPESALRLHWHDAGLGRPECQWWVFDDDGTALYRIDIADPAALYGAEYDGEEFHSTDADIQHDLERRQWLSEHRHWTVDPFRKDPVFHHPELVPGLLQAGHARARHNLSLWTPTRRT
jgi:hypothetical protein